MMSKVISLDENVEGSRRLVQFLDYMCMFMLDGRYILVL